MGGPVPWLSSRQTKNKHLEARAENNLCQHGQEHLFRQEVSGRALGVQGWIRPRPSHGHGDRQDNKEVNEQELKVTKGTCEIVQDRDTRELNQAVQCHVLETAKACDQRCAALFDDLNHA